MALPPIPTDFIAHWPGTISGGTLVEETGSYPATISGTVTREIGRVGEAVVFGATSTSWAQTADSAGFVFAGSFSATTFINYGASQSISYPRIIESRKTSGTDEGWLFYYNEVAGALSVDFVGIETLSVAVAMPVGGAHCAFVYTWGVGAEFFINGLSVGTSLSAITTIHHATMPVILGNATGGNGQLVGWLNRTKLYPRALTADEIKSLALERPTIPTAGLVAAYNFADMAAGVVPDSAPGATGANDATITGAVTKTGMRSGVGAALSGSQGIAIPVALGATFSIATSVSAATPTGGQNGAFSFGWGDGTDQIGLITHSTEHATNFVIQAGSDAAWRDSGIPADGSISEIAITYDATTLRVYRAGVETLSFTTTLNITTSGYLGNLAAAGAAFTGSLGPLRCYSEAKTPTEIALLATERQATPTLGLVSHWTMGDIQGTTLIDEMGANNGVITGATQIEWETGPGLDFSGAGARVQTAQALPAMSEMAISFFAGAINNSSLELISECSINSNSVAGAWWIGANGAGGGQFNFIVRKIADGAALSVASPLGINDGVSTYHILAVYDSAGATVADQVKLYIDGVLQVGSSGTNTSPVLTAAHALNMGLRAEGLLYETNGVLDEYRVLSSIPDPLDILALANESVPYAVAGTVLEDGAPVARTLRVYDSETGALLGTTTSNGDGDYSLPLDTNADVLVMAVGGAGYRSLVHGPVTIT